MKLYIALSLIFIYWFLFPVTAIYTLSTVYGFIRIPSGGVFKARNSTISSLHFHRLNERLNELRAYEEQLAQNEEELKQHIIVMKTYFKQCEEEFERRFAKINKRREELDKLEDNQESRAQELLLR